MVLARFCSVLSKYKQIKKTFEKIYNKSRNVRVKITTNQNRTGVNPNEFGDA